MFAIPGWSLSAPLKTQTESDVPIAKTTNRDDEAQTNSRPSKKRKRKHGKEEGEEVTSENLGSMWDEIIEGKQSVKGSEPEKVEQKVRKPDKLKNGVKEPVEADDGENSNSIQKNKHQSQDTEEPKQKKKRRKKDKYKQHDSTPALPHESAREPAPPPPSNSTSEPTPITHPETQPRSELNPAPPTKLTPLQTSMRAKLAAARFRHLNQTLYTTPSTSALKLFSENPEMYDEYHTGFRQQVAVWPENPADSYIGEVKVRAAVERNVKNKNGKEWRQKGAEGGDGTRVPGSPKPLPRTQGVCTIADLGCGEARMAKELATRVKKMGLRILSFDLRASEFVQVADISALPLVDGRVDVAVFCLALMGTNWTDFVDEAWRVLRWRGELWVSEIKSRFGRKHTSGVVEHSVGNRKRKLGRKKEDGNAGQENTEDTLDAEVDGVEGERDETDVGDFVAVLRKRGFVLDGEEKEAVDLRNKMFVKMRFIKNLQPVKGKNAKASWESGASMRAKKFKGKWLEDYEDDEIDESKVLKPCVYKLR